MYNIHFYVCCLLLAFFIGVFCLLILSIIAWNNSLKARDQITLALIHNKVKLARNSKELEIVYNKFLEHFKKIPENSFQEWIQCVNDLIATDLASLDMIIQLKEELENENPTKRKEIANTVALILKNKKN
ncbi:MULTISPECIES: hypothetical protein [unclassified Helicobacter]|uniref:hypothetical protein n=1 Tax=unclassified Helicobacter TaxID=2593540 RepID=UPI000CF1417D|nr:MULTISPECIES: hypothetical protein [unclassified Helicobacter]